MKIVVSDHSLNLTSRVNVSQRTFGLLQTMGVIQFNYSVARLAEVFEKIDESVQLCIKYSGDVELDLKWNDLATTARNNLDILSRVEIGSTTLATSFALVAEIIVLANEILMSFANHDEGSTDD